MLKLSGISRSIMVILYTVFMCFVAYLAVNEKNVSEMSMAGIAIYIVIVIFCICLYQVIKRRLRGKTDNQTVRRLYRFAYLAVVLVVSRILVVFFAKDSIIHVEGVSGLAGEILKLLVSVTNEAKYSAIILNTIIAYINSVIIKRIMLNIFENDAVATMSSIIYILSPISLMNCWKFETSNFNTMFILLGIYLIYLIHDEISEYGLKSKKYLYLSGTLAVIVGLDILFGNNGIGWIALSGAAILLPDYIDKATFKIKSKKLNINKGIVTFSMVLISSIIFWLILKLFNMEIYSFGRRQDIFATTNKLYLLSGLVVILFETLSVALNRRNSFKVAFMKTAVVIFGIITVYYMNSLIVFEALFSMAFVLSIGNMYYNREEKIKLLKSGN